LRAVDDGHLEWFAKISAVVTRSQDRIRSVEVGRPAVDAALSQVRTDRRARQTTTTSAARAGDGRRWPVASSHRAARLLLHRWLSVRHGLASGHLCQPGDMVPIELPVPPSAVTVSAHRGVVAKAAQETEGVGRAHAR
jgi:hypothetical protein